MPLSLIFYEICNIILKCIEKSLILWDGGNALKKRAILFVFTVCLVTIYGILSADHYFQLNNLKKQMELAAGRIQTAQTACREADNVLLDYYMEYTQKNAGDLADAVSVDTSSAEEGAMDAEAMQSALNSFNIQDTRYQEIQIRMANSEQNLNSAVRQYNHLAEEYNQKISSPLFFPISKLMGYKSVLPLPTDC